MYSVYGTHHRPGTLHGRHVLPNPEAHETATGLEADHRQNGHPVSKSEFNAKAPECFRFVEATGETVVVTARLDWVRRIDRLRFESVDKAIAVQSVQLPGDFHKDPADRLIVATVRQLGAALITADDKIRAYPHVRTIW